MPGHKNRETNRRSWAAGGYREFGFPRPLASRPPRYTRSSKLPGTWRGHSKDVLRYLSLGETPTGRKTIVLEMREKFTPKQIAALTGFSEGYVYEIIRQKFLEGFRLSQGSNPWWYEDVQQNKRKGQ